MNEIEVKAKEIQDGLDLAKKAEKEVTEVKTEVATIKEDVNSVKTGVTELKGDVDKMQTSIEQIANDVKKIGMTKEEKKSFREKMKEILFSDEFKGQLKEVYEKKRQGTGTFEVKTDPTTVVTSGLTGDVTRTMPGEIFTQGYEPNKFLAAMNVVTVPQNKDKAMWFDGAYYDNVGYVGELTAVTTGDGATLEEKYRELAKVGAFLAYSSEVADDMDYFLNWATNEGVETILGKIDDLIYSGAGADVTKPKEIYGIKAKGSTAFSASTAGLALSITSANLADLIRAAQTQIRIQTNGKYSGNLVYLHPANVAKLYMLKNTQADYINILPNGSMMVYGIPIAESTRIAVGEMLLVDTRTLKLYQKGSLELETERIASTDSFKLHMRWRGQVVVPTNAILGNVYVSNITTAIAAIDAATTTAAPTTLAPTTTAAPTTTTT